MLKHSKSPNDEKNVDKSFSTGLFRVSSEILASLIVGAGLGYMLDSLFNTKPLFLILLFFLGGISGIYNLWRQVSGYGLKFGYFDKKDK